MPQGHKEEYYEELARIINLCQSISTKSDDPFLVDIPQKLIVLKQLLPKWKVIDDLLMDAEAIKELSLMVKLQSDWVKRRATGLFIDPFLVEVKIKVMPKESLASALLSSWHPLIAAEQLTEKRLADAMDYWNILLPLEQRLKELEVAHDNEEKTLTVSELIKLKFLSDKIFNEEIQMLHSELLESTKDAPMDYWKFILRDTYEETVLRAYALSFLISGGQANLIINPVEETTVVEGNVKPEQKKTGGKSVPIAVTYRKWKEMIGVKNE
jgi:hypothetical protein